MTMRIAHVVGTCYPRPGGMGTVAYDECAALVKSGFEPTIFTLSYGGREEQFATAPFPIARLHPWPRSGDAGLTPELLWRLRGFDLVHLHYPWYGGAEWVWLQKKLGGTPYVVTYHMDAAPTEVFKKIVSFVYDPIIGGLVLRSAAAVFTVDDEHFKRSRFANTIAPRALVALPNPIDVDVFKPQLIAPASAGLGGLEGKRIVLFVGNLLKVKRLDLLIEALAYVPPDVVLVVVGSGYAQDEYIELVQRRGLGARVRFVGSQPRAALAKYYSLAACTVVPSDAESFSLVMLEALATGSPVVASDLPGLLERLCGAGAVFKPGSVTDLARAITRVLAWQTNERLQKISLARRRVTEHYSIERHMAILEATYKAVIHS